MIFTFSLLLSCLTSYHSWVLTRDLSFVGPFNQNHELAAESSCVTSLTPGPWQGGFGSVDVGFHLMCLLVRLLGKRSEPPLFHVFTLRIVSRRSPPGHRSTHRGALGLRGSVPQHYLQTHARQGGKGCAWQTHGRHEVLVDRMLPMIGWSCKGSLHSECRPDSLGWGYSPGARRNQILP